MREIIENKKEGENVFDNFLQKVVLNMALTNNCQFFRNTDTSDDS